MTYVMSWSYDMCNNDADGVNLRRSCKENHVDADSDDEH
jgi:hypothetical protein